MVEDQGVQSSLCDYCQTAYAEGGRHIPFADLANRIVELGRGSLTGLTKTYPMDDFCFANSWYRPIATIEEHKPDLLAARKPDGLALRPEAAKKLGN